MSAPTAEQLDAIRAEGFRPQAVLAFMYEGKLLFVYHEGYDLWQLPQGGIRNGETLLDAAVREAEEELGKTFADKQKDAGRMFLGEDRVEFPPDKHGSKPLATDDGTEVTMIGKHYFFLAVTVTSDALDMSETEFDDHAWMDAGNAVALAKTIYQSGKRRVTTHVLELLIEEGLLA